MDSRQLINSCGALEMIISKVPGTHKGTVGSMQSLIPAII